MLHALVAVVLSLHSLYSPSPPIPTSPPISHLPLTLPPPLPYIGLVEEILFEARMLEKASCQVFQQSKQGPINGMTSHAVNLHEHIPVSDSIMCAPQPQNGGSVEVRFTDLCPGSVVAFK